jgi:hypothetical protein
MVWYETRFGVFLYIVARLRKPELIIRENQPIELPPEVVRGRVQLHVYAVCCSNICMMCILINCSLFSQTNASYHRDTSFCFTNQL